MISPIWARPAIGQLIRGGVDYRSYLRQIALISLFKKREGDLGVLEGWWKSRHCQRVSEEELQTILQSGRTKKKSPISVDFDEFVFRFEPLNGWNDFLHEELRSLTRKKYLDFVDSIDSVPLGVNIRCGNDFGRAPDDPTYARVGWLQKTPISWYCETIKSIRKSLNRPAKAIVVSDGTAEALKEVLDLGNVTFLRPGSAITDLLVLTKSRVLIGTGSSTFSAWASFFGQMPTVTAPGHPLTKWGIETLKNQYNGEFNPHSPSDEFLEQACANLVGE